MRMIVLLPILMLAACNVENDPQNDQMTLEYDQNRIENAAEDVGNTAENLGEAIENEVGDIDLDLDVGGNEANSAN